MKKTLISALAISSLSILCQADIIPLDLPAPDGTPGDATKPVKVYILAGQSNMVGMGDLRGARPEFPSVFLSADPAIIPGVMPIGNSALRAHGIWQAADPEAEPGAVASLHPGAYDPDKDLTEADATRKMIPLGTVAETLPALDGPHTLVARAWIDVPETGRYKIHAGFGESSYARVMLGERRVYQKMPGGSAEYELVDIEAGRRHPITITYFKPGSAAFWLEQVDLKGRGDLETLVKKEGRYPYLLDQDGEWSVRKDVYFQEARLSKNGRGSLLSATSNGNSIGPELGFGSVMGTFHGEQVLLIKTAQGNRSLAYDFRPPTSGVKDPESQWEGLEYRLMVQGVRETLAKLDEIIPDYQGQGYEIAGFAWWQGHKDAHSSKQEYETHLIHLIEDLRKEFNAPEMPAVVATVGFEGYRLSENYQGVWEAQMAVGDQEQHPEFAKRVASVDTRDFWREISESPRPQGHHYHRNAETYLLVGEAMGREMVRLRGGRAEAIPKSNREQRVAAEIAADAAAPDLTQSQRAASNAAAKPMILDGALVNYLSDERNKNALREQTAGERPQRVPPFLNDHIDEVVRYYGAAGYRDFGWKPFGPDLAESTWRYFSFNLPKRAEGGGADAPVWTRVPGSMANWIKPEFDADKANWKSGAAPFGPEKFNQDLPEHLRWASRSRKKPATVINEDVLLLRQTIDLPPLEDNHRYRIIVDGSARSNSGDAYAIHVNGNLIAETAQGVAAWRRASGLPRGAHIYQDLRKFMSGRVTLAVATFPRSNSPDAVTPHRNSLRIWIEEQKLPPGLPNPQ